MGAAGRRSSTPPAGAHGARSPRPHSARPSRAGVPVASVQPLPAAPASRAGLLPPTPIGSLLGRGRELALARKLLADGARLLTLTGPGGVGKTRLALAVAAELGEAATDRLVCFADLAPLREPALVQTTIARAFGLAAWNERVPLAEALAARLHGWRALLVLDNCEQVLGGARVVGPLLEALPELIVLTTSREPLRLRIEQELPVPPLPLPFLGYGETLDQLAANAAVQLFAQRARAVDPSFQLTQVNVRSVAEVCVQLDGLPLAIELAAARTKLLPPAALLERLARQLDLDLAARATDVPARQQTLRATLAWSHALLMPEEEVLFRRLAVFAGGWTLEAAEAVCGGDGLDPEQIVDVLGRLVDKSLVLAEEHGEVRYRLLEIIREYASERLTDPAERAALEWRHAEWCLAVAQGTELGLWVRDSRVGLAEIQTRLARLEVEHDNLRAALRRLVRAGDAPRGLRLASAAYTFWYQRGHFGEGRAWLTELLRLPAAAQLPAARALALSYLGQLAYCQSDFAAADASLETGVAIFRALGDRVGLGVALVLWGNSARGRGDLVRAQGLYEQAGQLYSELQGSRWGMSYLIALAETVLERGEHQQASAVATAALEESRERQLDWATARALELLGRLAARSGDVAGARALQEQALELQIGIKDTQGLVISLTALGQAAYDEGQPARARSLYQQALRRAWESGSLLGVARALEGLGATLAAVQPDESVELVSTAAALRDRLGAARYPVEETRLERCLEGLRRRLGTTAYALAWSAGQATPIEQSVSRALADDQPNLADVPPAPARGARISTLLSPREREVAALIAQGLTSAEIAERLVITARTADTHADNIRSKLGLRSRTEIASWATAHELTS